MNEMLLSVVGTVYKTSEGESIELDLDFRDDIFEGDLMENSINTLTNYLSKDRIETAINAAVEEAAQGNILLSKSDGTYEAKPGTYVDMNSVTDRANNYIISHYNEQHEIDLETQEIKDTAAKPFISFVAVPK